MRTLGIVPARRGSKRVPRKNLRLLAGKPLVARAIEAAVGARRLSRIVVSSDDEQVLSIAGAYGEVLPLVRPTELATDEALAIDYVHHALQALRAAGEGEFDAVAIVQPTSPFTKSEDVDLTIELCDRSGADSAVTVMPVPQVIHPWKLKVLQGNRLLPYLQEEQGQLAAHQIPKVYVRNGSVYVTRLSSLERGEIIGSDCRAHVMPAERSLDINDEMDWQLAEFIAQRAIADTEVRP